MIKIKTAAIKFKNCLIKEIAGNIDIILFFISVSIKALIFLNKISENAVKAQAKYSTFASVFVFVAIAILFKKRYRIKLLFIFDLFLSIIIIIDVNYYRYFNDLVSINSIKNLSLLYGVKDSVINILNVSDLLYFVDIVIMLPLIIRFKKFFDKKSSLLKRTIAFLILASAGIIISENNIKSLRKEQPGLIESMRNKTYIAKSIGIFNYHGEDICNVIESEITKHKRLPVSTKNDIKKMFASNKQNASSEFSGIGSGKNLIMIQVESLQQFVIGRKINGQEITPNLNRWLGKSLYFDNFFHQVAAGNTSDAEFMVNNSLYPAATGAAYYLYSGDKLNSLAENFKSKNYYTAAFHANNEVFWNRNVMYNTESFDHFYGQHSFTNDEKLGLGLSDQSFLNQTFEKLKTLKEPYYSFIITLTSHYPFDALKNKSSFDVGKYNGTLFGDYLQSIHYTDEQLGSFLDKLESSGIMDKSIIVLYGDHSAIPVQNIGSLYDFVGEKNNDDYTWYQYQKVPFMIHFPFDYKNGVDHSYTGQMNVYPTIADMFNLNPKYVLGKDMFSSDKDKVVFRNGSFIYDGTFYLSSSDSYYDINTGQKETPTNEIKSYKNQIDKELSYSDYTLDKNLIKEFEKED